MHIFPRILHGWPKKVLSVGSCTGNSPFIHRFSTDGYLTGSGHRTTLETSCATGS